MAGHKWGLIGVGVILLLLGIIFALQGADILKGSPVMSGNTTYIYVGGVVAILGVILMLVGSRSRPSSAT